MIRKKKKDIPLYEEYGVFTEAKKKKRKPRIVAVGGGDKRATDFTAGVEPIEEIDIDTSEFDDDLDNEDYSAFDDFSDDIDDISDTPTADNNTTEPQNTEPGGDTENMEDNPPLTTDGEDTPPTTDTASNDSGNDGTENTPMSDGDDSNTLPTTDSENPDDGTSTDGGTETIDVGDSDGLDGLDSGNDDFTANADSTDSGNGLDTPQTDTPTQPTDNTTNSDPTQFNKDDMKKFELFKRYISIYATIENFISSLNTVMPDDHNEIIAVKTAISKLTSLENLTKDYMLLKFKSDTYLQNAFFFEKIKASILLILELVGNNILKPSKKQKRK